MKWRKKILCSIIEKKFLINSGTPAYDRKTKKVRKNTGRGIDLCSRPCKT